jgi:hypothetical protein
VRALLLLLLGCGPTDITWTLPADMLPEERAAFGEACERWNAVAVVQQSADEHAGSYRVEMRLQQHMHNGPTTAAEYNRSEQRMHIARGLARAQFLTAVMHEQGHALGRGHVDAGVMAPNGSDSAEFSGGDLAECRRVGACR